MKSQRRGWRYAILVVGLVLLALLVMDFNSRMAELSRLSSEREQVRVRATGVMETQMALQGQIAYATSEPAVERWAYEDAHMIRPGDKPVVPIAASQSTPTPTPAPKVTPPVISNWQKWLSLFTGPVTP